MSDLKKAKILFEKWSAEFKGKDKDKEHYYGNFYDLFVEMKRIDIPFDTAYDFIKDAVNTHAPTSSVLKFIYKRSQVLHRRYTEQEFFEEWKGLIKSKAYEAFHDVYPIAEKETVEVKPKAELPKGMSREEYRLQRKHAESFPILDLSKIEDPYKNIKDDDDFSLDDLEK